ncbi:unnamed protein product [Brugia timori]|uniref:KH_dom_type_1 domain-containing protein n=2 Tax=Brugia TaxID=6278 RepID=A0A0R3QUM6_9BILA|nr:unnamed protein product [Brugia timori]
MFDKNLSNLFPEKSDHKPLNCQTVSLSNKLFKVKISVDNALKLNSKFRSLLKYLESVLLPRIKQTEKLIFVGQETQEIRHLIVKPNASGERLIIAGPKDIKTKLWLSFILLEKLFGPYAKIYFDGIFLLMTIVKQLKCISLIINI